MKKYVTVFLKVVLSLLLIMPILGALHVFPAPTADMYTNPQAFAFVQLMMGSASYINYLMALVFFVALVLMWTKRMALAALLISPIVVNIVAFHVFLDGGIFTKGSIPAVVLAALNAYFFWDQRENYTQLLVRK